METTTVLTATVTALITGLISFWMGMYQERRKAVDSAIVQEESRRIAQVFDERKTALHELLVLMGRASESAANAAIAAENGWAADHYHHLRQSRAHEIALRELLIKSRSYLGPQVSAATQSMRRDLQALSSHLPESTDDELPDFAGFTPDYLQQLRVEASRIDRSVAYLEGAVQAHVGPADSAELKSVLQRGATTNRALKS
jgi:hypothetical protein